MESSSTQVQVPSDMLFEILSRSSFNTLATCKLLSKDCNRLTYDSSFLNLHSQRTNTLSGFFLQTLRFNQTSASFFSDGNPNHNISLDFLPSQSVQGILVCIEDKRIPRYYVCKPLTKEWQRIPNPKTKYFTESIAIKVLKSKPLHYKIVRLSQPKHRYFGKYNCLRCEIFDSMVGKWRQIEQVKLPCDEHFFSWIPAISVCGRFHWLTSAKKVLAFDVDDEKYDVFSLPFGNDYKHVQLTEYEGKLGVIGKEGNFMEVWVMEIYKKKEWAKMMRVGVEEAQKETCYPVGFCNANVAFLVPEYYRFLLFKFKNGNGVQKVRLNILSMQEGVFRFRSDFELCGLKNEFSNKKSMRKVRRVRQYPYYTVSSTLVILLVLFFFTLMCFVLDF